MIIILNDKQSIGELVKNISTDSITVLDSASSYSVIQNPSQSYEIGSNKQLSIQADTIEPSEEYMKFSDSLILKTSDNDFITFL